ncbi:uncharacterized protein LOC107643542 isoform X1 [Arachis ipaensis]|uniref:uncharacterized protein LOC107643542 isoform X1 n=2 Tax=Arachis ipaensis TaxID=130454 RepID=UPI000A2B390E|nr:uncharacterized protein LOC107643542 isoform X1 [Arachis ipaensis]XP_025626431.1 uncharacterized protein LOC112719910 isoform X1 [Arachis hypogaea]
MLTDELERLESFTQIFFNPNAFQYGVAAGQDYSNTKKSMTHPSCHLSSGRHVISGMKLFSQDSEFDILEDGLVSVRVDYDFNYDDISASQKFYSLSIGLYESNTDFQEGNGHQENNFQFTYGDYFDFGDPISICQECGALMWYDERNRKNRNYIIPEFSLCCSLGKVQLPFLTEPPEVLKELLYDYGSKHYKNFQNNIRAYNQMFAFTSSAGKVDSSINKGHRRAPTVYKISGENIHYIGSLMPMPGEKPKFAQLYIYDTENEVNNRIAPFRSNDSEYAIDSEIVGKLQKMLDENNALAKSFRMAKERFAGSNTEHVRLKLLSSR